TLVGNIFRHDLLTVQGYRAIFNTIKQVDFSLRSLLEFSKIFISPPILHITEFIELSTVIVKGMRNFVCNNNADSTIISSTTLFQVIEWFLQNCSWES